MELYHNALRHFKWLSHSHEANSRSIRLYWILDMDLPGTFPLALGILMVVLIKSLHVHWHIIWKGRDGPSLETSYQSGYASILRSTFCQINSRFLKGT
jgi:hypothetical protein